MQLSDNTTSEDVIIKAAQMTWDLNPKKTSFSKRVASI